MPCKIPPPVPEWRIRKIMGLKDFEEIIYLGYEHLFTQELLNTLSDNFSRCCQLVRNLPDYMILNHNTGESYFVEWKEKHNLHTLEACSLFQNKGHQTNGHTVIYILVWSDTDFLKINVNDIPVPITIVPLNRREEFDKYFEPLFVKANWKIKNIGMVTGDDASGDPFVPISKEYLKILVRNNS